MPKLYEYFGMVILFYANDHLPIHIHVEGKTGTCKVEFVVINGKVTEAIIKKIKGKKMPNSGELQKLNELIRHYSEDIVKKWEQFHVEKKKIKSLKITRRLK